MGDRAVVGAPNPTTTHRRTAASTRRISPPTRSAWPTRPSTAPAPGLGFSAARWPIRSGADASPPCNHVRRRERDGDLIEAEHVATELPRSRANPPRVMPSTTGPSSIGTVSPEALVLALSTVVRPTSAAAVFAMLATARPARLLLAYIITGFAFSAGIGVVVVILLSGWTGPEAPDEVRAVIGIVLGAVSLGYAAGLLSGRVQQPGSDADDNILAPAADSWLGRQLAHLSVPRAAVAGVLTHVPGLFYITALNAITNSTSRIGNQLVQVSLYNAIWFALPAAALVLATRRPVELKDFLRRVTGSVARREREILITAFGLLGAYLIIKGVAVLLP
jgi:hypothetical protein